MPGVYIPKIQDHWTVLVPQMALEYEPLLNQLLALTCLHLIISGTNDPELLSCRSTYLDAALRTHRQGIGHLGHQNADAACFTSIMLLIDAFASMRERSLDPYQPPMHWLRIVRGARSVFEITVKMATSSSTSAFMDLAVSTRTYSGPETLHGIAGRKELPKLFSAAEAAHDDDGELLDVYRQTITYLGSIKRAIEDRENILIVARRLLAFASLVPVRFLDLVEEMRPWALMLLGQFFELAKIASGEWWVGDIPEREAGAIWKQMPTELRALMEQPAARCNN